MDRGSSSLNTLIILTSTHVQAFQIKPANTWLDLIVQWQNKQATNQDGIRNPEFRVTGMVGLQEKKNFDK